MERAPIWSPYFEIGDPVIDGEHKMILSALTDFFITVNNDLGERLSLSVLIVLCGYFKGHCENEERLMGEIAGTGFEHHRAEHRRFLERLADIRQRFTDGKEVRPALSQFFHDFLHRHVLTEDLNVAERARGDNRPASPLGWLRRLLTPQA
ncbi:MAG: hemerythrin domain-containing protein [Rhodospirillaceae bacterium]